MKAEFIRVSPYAGDALNLPVEDVESSVSWYEQIFGFTVRSRSEDPVCSVILARDGIEIGLAENGGDPTQEGCFFEVDDVETAFAELKENGLAKPDANYQIDKYGDTSYRVFFVIAPDGLCYCIGEKQV